MNPLCILLLEDHPLDAELIQAHLSEGGLTCDVHRVDTRQAFVTALHERCPDLILADYSLPAFDGMAALEIARETCPQVPFLFVSGAIGEERAIESLKGGATDYVLKHNLDRLVPSVRRALREAEERAERKRATKALAESEERFRLLVNRVQEYAIFLLDPRGRVESWNEGAARILGYQAEEALGRELAHFFTPEDVQAGWPARVLEEARTRGQSQEDNWLVRKDGSRFWASGTTTALRDEGGQLRGFAKILRDLTDRKQLEEALHNRAEQLVEAARRKDEFLAILSHELRNPLTPLRNALEILRLADLGDPTAAEARDVMERQVRHLSRLVDDLLDVFRISHRKLLLRKDRLDLAQLARVVALDHRNALERAGLTLELKLPERPVWVLGDLTRLSQVLGNLLGNAAKFTDRGGRVTVRVKADESSQRALMQVSDTGIGLAAEVVPHLFDTFTQAEQARHRSRGGLGLGLALVKGLVELQGGTVAADSAGPGRGSTFTVCLPLSAESAAGLSVPLTGDNQGRRLRILIIEDNEDAARTLGVLLTRYGHEVATAYTGRSGVDTAGQWQPDVVLCDLGLPEMDGYDVARTLRGDPATARARLIAVSGYGQEDDRRQAHQAGFDLHLTKPVDPTELQHVLATIRAH
ncbi:MAG: response regulator [Gemmataceae bacterium]|nr:response regulator [Gemmataceae bacterium]